jgi:hypothetical protein
MRITFGVRYDGFVGSIPVYPLRDALDEGISNNNVGIRTTLHTLCQPKSKRHFFSFSLQNQTQT